MKVKVGNKVYDSKNEPVMVILSETDKNNIARLHPRATKYCSGPGNTTVEQLNRFMQLEGEPDPTPPQCARCGNTGRDEWPIVPCESCARMVCECCVTIVGCLICADEETR